MEGYCYDTGNHAAVAASSYLITRGGCPINWDAATATVIGLVPHPVYGCTDAPDLTIQLQSFSLPSCDVIGPLDVDSGIDPISDAVQVYGFGLLLLVGIWAGRRIYDLFTMESNRD